MKTDESLEIPEHFMWQLEAISYVSGKPLQAALNAVLVSALPTPDAHPENLLKLAVALVQPGDDLDALLDRFREVRDSEAIPLDEHSTIVAFEQSRGLMNEEEAALLDHANALITGQVEPVPHPSDEEKQRIADEILEDREGEEWK